MKDKIYLLDTHALFFWATMESVSDKFIDFFDRESKKGRVFFSSISIWEMAFLKKKGRVEINDLRRWKDDIINLSGAKMISPTADDMINSTLLPDHHADPFDRLLVAQAKSSSALLVTKDKSITKYAVKTFWV